MVDTIYTIGYSGFLIENFIRTLRNNHISLLVDVRSQPYSQYFSDYNMGPLQHILGNEQIHYRSYAREFGARQENREWQTDKGYLDFEKFAGSNQFLLGYNKLIKSMEHNYRAALMCAEKDPIDCHRSILVSRAFYNAGYNVIHILPNNQSMTQQDIEVRLVDKYYPDRYQLSLLETERSEAQYIQAAYQKQNAKIGFTLSEVEL